MGGLSWLWVGSDCPTCVPCMVLLPLLDQTCDLQTSKFGIVTQWAEPGPWAADLLLTPSLWSDCLAQGSGGQKSKLTWKPGPYAASEKTREMCMWKSLADRGLGFVFFNKGLHAHEKLH